MTEYINKRKAHIYCADSMLAGDITKEEADLIDDFLEGCSTIEIVRCKDCKYQHKLGGRSGWRGWCDRAVVNAGDYVKGIVKANDNDYCSLGEKKDCRKSAFEEYQDEVCKEYEYLHWDIR